jgi:hypothetical protein
MRDLILLASDLQKEFPGIILQCKDDLQREFYIRMTRRISWTKNVLIHHIELTAPEQIAKLMDDLK